MKLLATLLLIAGCGLQAQTPSPLIAGLLSPSKIVLTPAGNLLVTEVGQTPNSGRISIVDKSGTRRTLIDGLPSGLAAPDLTPDGPNGVLVQGNSIYILNGEGDGFRAGTRANTIVPNPAGPSSSLFSSLMKLTLSGSVDSAMGGMTLTAANQAALVDGNSATLQDSLGASATIEMVADFRDGVADAGTAWRNSHPYGLTALDSRPDVAYVADAGMNLVYEVTLSTGRSRVLTRFAPLPNPAGLAGPPVSDAVPTSIRPYGNQLLVSLLHGFPFPQGGSQVALVDPATGAVTPFIASLSSAIDVLSDARAQGRSVFYTVEFSSNMLATPAGAGRVTRYDTAQGRVIADGLGAPTSLAYDSSSQTLYVSMMAGGTILKITGQ